MFADSEPASPYLGGTLPNSFHLLAIRRRGISQAFVFTVWYFYPTPKALQVEKHELHYGKKSKDPNIFLVQNTRLNHIKISLSPCTLINQFSGLSYIIYHHDRLQMFLLILLGFLALPSLSSSDQVYFCIQSSHTKKQSSTQSQYDQPNFHQCNNVWFQTPAPCPGPCNQVGSMCGALTN